MKCFIVLLFFVASVQSTEGGRLLVCLTPQQDLVQDDSFGRFAESRDNYLQNMTDCIKANDAASAQDSSLITRCESQFNKELWMRFSEYFFANIGAEAIAMDPVDVESFKAATIQLVDMEDAEKTAALAEFDSCMAANYSLPYSFYSFRSDKMPDTYWRLLKEFNRGFNFSILPPTPAILAVDCMHTVLFHQGCGPDSEETIDQILTMLPKPRNNDLKMFQCLTHSSVLWIGDICMGSALQFVRNQNTSCVEGSFSDDGCSSVQMKLCNDAHAKCMLQLSKSGGSVQQFKEFMISGTNLTEVRKVATSASIDKCLAKNSTIPYDYFQFDQELIQGPPLLQNITHLMNRVYSFGNLLPSMELRIVDCAFAALTMNGCDATTPHEALMKELNAFTYLLKMRGVDY